LSKNSKTKNKHIGEFRLYAYDNVPTDYVAFRPLTEKQKEMVETVRQMEKTRVL